MSENHETLTDQTLNALLDREYSAREQARLMRTVNSDPEAARRLCELRALKETVQIAYAELPVTDLKIRKPAGRMRWLAAAASLLLALLLVAGLAVGPDPTGMAERFAMLDPSGAGQAPASAQSEEMRVVFHVQDMRQVSAAEVLDEVESLLLDFQLRHQPVRVEVVAHGEGLGLLRADMSVESGRIARMARDYPRLTFVACLNTIDRLKNEQGINVVLLPEAQTTVSGVAHLVRLQREGWFYIQV